MNPDAITSIAAWVGLFGLVPSFFVTLVYALGSHGAWRKSALGRVMFTLFLAMTLVYVVFLTQKIFGHDSWWYPLFSLAVFGLLMIAMWAVLFVMIHEQSLGELNRKPGPVVVKRVRRRS